MDPRPPDASTTIATPGLPGSRRRSLIARPHRLRATPSTAAAVLGMLVVPSLALYSITVSSADAALSDAPGLAQAIRSQARLQLLLIVIASVVFLGGIVAVSLIEGHHAAGAAFKLARALGRVEAGSYDAELRLRRGDHLTEVEAAFNRMTRALRDRRWHEIEALQRLADRVASSAGDEETGAAAIELRSLAPRMRRSQG